MCFHIERIIYNAETSYVYRKFTEQIEKVQLRALVRNSPFTHRATLEYFGARNPGNNSHCLWGERFAFVQQTLSQLKNTMSILKMHMPEEVAL